MENTLYEEIILNIMRRERQLYWDKAIGKFPHAMPTFIIRKHFNSESVLELTGKEMHRALIWLYQKGYVRKHPTSRIGQAYWQLVDEEE